MVCGYWVLRLLCWFWMLLFSFLLNYLSPSLSFLRQNKFLLIIDHPITIVEFIVVRFTFRTHCSHSHFKICLALHHYVRFTLKISLEGASEKKKSGEESRFFLLLKIPMRGIISKHTILLVHTEGACLAIVPLHS